MTAGFEHIPDLLSSVYQYTKGVRRTAARPSTNSSLVELGSQKDTRETRGERRGRQPGEALTLWLQGPEEVCFRVKL